VSPVFRHGRLRLYLLKLLDEAPRHGYEVIRLLQDRFLGVYAPSPGTIYPRLARLEEDGLVTHDEVNGRKIYRITEKGREEIRGRLGDLAELEEELADSVRDIAREVSQDVRETVRNLREELTWATRDVRRESRERAREHGEHGEHGEQEPAPDAGPDAGQDTGPDIGQERAGWQDWQDRAAAWQDRAAAWQDGSGWRGHPGGSASPPGPGSPRSRSRRGGSGWDTGLLRDLERMATEFAGELRDSGWHAEGIAENAAANLRGILEDALTRIKDEVFRGPATGGPAGGQGDTDDGERPDGAGGSEPGGPAPDGPAPDGPEPGSAGATGTTE
jgi:DNA-binding PadR family transcriptional regulator